MAKRAPGYRPKRLFAVESLATKGMTDNKTSQYWKAPPVCMSVWCGALSDMSDMSDKSDLIGAPQVQKKDGAAKHRVLQQPPYKSLRKHKSTHVGNNSLFFSGRKIDLKREENSL